MVHFPYSKYQTVSDLRAYAVSYSFLHPLLGLEETRDQFLFKKYIFTPTTHPFSCVVEYSVEYFKNSDSSL